MSERPVNGSEHAIADPANARDIAKAHMQRAIDARDSLRRYLIDRMEVLRVHASSPERDLELAHLELWIHWLRGAI